eukprot:TRINITY_DN31892_c0_g1_i2.p1 TRINITY_DN31892_c0_g1~~TRINITY_DN31892_c0_g1_i2.p1  ORF type:complete len:347 (+),score=72.02 TRINITY_DN31892_c0_g1_i2:1-1041(+)
MEGSSDDGKHYERRTQTVRTCNASRCRKQIISSRFLGSFFFFQAEDGIRDVERSRGLGDVYKRQTKNLKEAIVDLYLNVKVRSQEEISKFNEKKYESEKSVLLDKDPLLILEYIKSSIEIIMNIKAEDACPDSFRGEITPREPPKDYELIIQKLEAEVRSHIRVEQQLKLHIEGLQSKYEELLKQHDNQLRLLQENAQKLGAEKVQKEAELKSARDTIRELSNKLSHPLAHLQENEVKMNSLKISGTESSKTAQNISTEEHLKNFPPDIGQLAKSGEMAKRNAATTLCKNWPVPGAPHFACAVRRPSEGYQTWGKTGTGKKNQKKRAKYYPDNLQIPSPQSKVCFR